MRQRAGGSATAGGLSGSARSLRHLVAGEWRSGDGDELLDVSPTRPSETVAAGHLAQDRDLDQTVYVRPSQRRER